MKVCNLTDVSTPKLEQHKLVKHSISVAGRLLAPGESTDVPDDQLDGIRKGVQALITAGALSIGPQPPASYLLARDAKKAAATAATIPPPSKMGRGPKAGE